MTEEIIDTSGFYKHEEPFLHHGPNFVYDAEFTLRREEVEEYKALDVLPIDGWHWFDSAQEARVFFGIPEPVIEEEITE